MSEGRGVKAEMKYPEIAMIQVICIDNEGYEASLEQFALYWALPDAKAESKGMIRVLDESGEDYLYPVDMFEPIQIPKVAV